MSIWTQSEIPCMPVHGISFWLAVFMISVQPFADIVASYACHDRKKEVKYVIHLHTSPLLERVDSISIISYYNRHVYGTVRVNLNLFFLVV